MDREIGTVDRIELDPASGRLEALWVRALGVFAQDMRIPAEGVQQPGPNADLWVPISCADLKGPLGPASALARPPASHDPDGVRVVTLVVTPPIRKGRRLFVTSASKGPGRARSARCPEPGKGGS